MQLPIPHRFRQAFIFLCATLVLTMAIAACSSGSVTSSNVVGSAPTSVQPQASSSGDAGTNTLDQIIAAQKVRIAVPQEFPPFGFIDKDMKPQGYDIDVATMLAKDLKVELELVPVTSDNRIPFLQTNKVDMIIASLGANPERAKSIYFSRAYAPFFSGIYGNESANVASYADLTPYKIGVTQGALEDLELTKQAPQGVAIQRFKDNSLTVSALLAGQVDLIATSNAVAARIIKENPDKKIGQKFVMKNSPCYIGIRRGDLDMLQWINVFISSKKMGGDLDTLSRKWFGEPLGDLPS